jgi:putative SOS response-associated peptidase YedK
MCGRYTLAVEMNELAERFGCPMVEPVFKPRYNVAPAQLMPVVVDNDGRRELQYMRWGLVPFWAKDYSISSRLINARIETVAQKPAFKYALKLRRCIVPADGYYEWQKIGNRKKPVRITLPQGGLFGFAGLWERWNSPDGEAFNTYTILTASPAASVAIIHHRMPLVLDFNQEDYWLNGMAGNSPEEFLSRLNPVQYLKAYPVSTRVNSPANDDPLCIEPVIQA